jgi:mRNA interferase YafQ
MKYKLFKTKKFQKSSKKIRFNDMDEMNYIDVVYKLLNGLKLDEKYKDHQLKGSLKDFRECHIRADLLLIYRVKDDILELVDIGTHSELFR